mmetsp:Transcript_36628/g.80256  ORF Transcript_36628/g.80256 Transcript_36628/m.80256 type:complete len:205 (+) Transcript_36628:102-716(+)
MLGRAEKLCDTIVSPRHRGRQERCRSGPNLRPSSNNLVVLAAKATTRKALRIQFTTRPRYRLRCRPLHLHQTLTRLRPDTANQSCSDLGPLGHGPTSNAKPRPALPLWELHEAIRRIVGWELLRHSRYLYCSVSPNSERSLRPRGSGAQAKARTGYAPPAYRSSRRAGCIARMHRERPCMQRLTATLCSSHGRVRFRRSAWHPR